MFHPGSLECLTSALMLRKSLHYIQTSTRPVRARVPKSQADTPTVNFSLIESTGSGLNQLASSFAAGLRAVTHLH